MSCSSSRRAGFTIAEALVVLAVMALVISVVAGTRPGASESLQREAEISAFLEAASEKRRDAILTGNKTVLMLTDTRCEDSPQMITFYPSGTANEATLCFVRGEQTTRFTIDPLTGYISQEASE